MPFGRTFTVNESADYLGVSTKTVRRYLKRDLLKHRLVRGKHGPELRIFKNSLDRLAGHLKELSKDREDVLEFNRLFQEASPEVREVVLKILRSTGEKAEREQRSNGLIATLFGKKSGVFR